MYTVMPHLTRWHLALDFGARVPSSQGVRGEGQIGGLRVLDPPGTLIVHLPGSSPPWPEPAGNLLPEQVEAGAGS